MRSELLASLSLCSRYKRIFWLLSYWTPVSEPMSFNMDAIQRQSLPTCHLPQLIQKWFCSSRVTEKEKCWKWNTRCRLTGLTASLSHVVWGRHQTDCSLSLSAVTTAGSTRADSREAGITQYNTLITQSSVLHVTHIQVSYHCWSGPHRRSTIYIRSNYFEQADSALYFKKNWT